MQLTPALIKGFVQKYLISRYDSASPIPWCHEKWWEMCCSDAKYVAIAAPREHAKSTAITHAYTLAELMFRQSDFTIVCSDTEGQATDFLNDIKAEFIENEALVRDFSFKRLIKDTQTEIIGQFTDGSLFRVLAKGAEQKFRGLKWRNRRPRSIIFDDVENDDIVLNKERREKFRRWVKGAVLPALSKGGRFRVVGTVLHMDSFLEKQMPDVTDASTVIMPLYEFSRHGMWYSAKFRAHNEDYSEILWPHRYPKEYWVELREEFINAGMADVYSQEYMNHPIDEKSAFFRREDFKPFESIPPVEYYAAADLAFSTEAKRDWTAIAVIGVDAQGMFYVVDMVRGRWDSLGVIDEIFAVNLKYKPRMFFLEKGKEEKAISPILYSEMMKRGVINLDFRGALKDKMARARAFNYRMKAGGVKFDMNAHWFPVLQEEMLRFDKAPHDDQVDALAYIGEAINEIHEYEQNDDDQFRPPMRQGRNRTTGY